MIKYKNVKQGDSRSLGEKAEMSRMVNVLRKAFFLYIVSMEFQDVRLTAYETKPSIQDTMHPEPKLYAVIRIHGDDRYEKNQCTRRA